MDTVNAGDHVYGSVYNVKNIDVYGVRHLTNYMSK